MLLGARGNGGTDLVPSVAERITFFGHPSFAEMTTPVLVVVGDEDVSPHLTSRGADWHADPYALGPGPRWLLSLFGAGRGLGGVSGYDVAETTDEDPGRVAAVQRPTWAWLRTALYPADPAATAGPAEQLGDTGRIESK